MTVLIMLLYQAQEVPPGVQEIVSTPIEKLLSDLTDSLICTSCPVVRTGKLCIEVTPESKIAFISERLCIGCGICPKKCPFDAIHIINLPTNLDTQVTHRYSANSFKLHRLPTPRPNQVLGLVGTNGIGKSTALKILAGKLKPNLGRYDDPPDWEEILKYFRGSELQSMSNRVLNGMSSSLTKIRLLHQGARGQSQSSYQAAVCGSDSQGCQGREQNRRLSDDAAVPSWSGETGRNHRCAW